MAQAVPVLPPRQGARPAAARGTAGALPRGPAGLRTTLQYQVQEALQEPQVRRRQGGTVRTQYLGCRISVRMRRFICC